MRDFLLHGRHELKRPTLTLIMPQGGQEPDGNFARAALGKAVNAVLSRFHYETHDGVADTNAVTVLGGDEAHAVAAVIDKTNNLAALVEVQGDGGGAAILAQSGSHFGATLGADGTVNVGYDTDHYEVENQTGSDADFEVVSVRTP